MRRGWGGGGLWSNEWGGGGGTRIRGLGKGQARIRRSGEWRGVKNQIVDDLVKIRRGCEISFEMSSPCFRI